MGRGFAEFRLDRLSIGAGRPDHGVISAIG
jgi:hypothetical protein